MLSVHHWLSPGWPCGSPRLSQALGHVAGWTQPATSPYTGRGHPHQPPTLLDQAQGSCCTVQPRCTAARWNCCWFSHLFLNWKYIFKGRRGDHPSHFHKRRWIRWDEDEDVAMSALLLPASKGQRLIYHRFQAMFILPWPQVPHSFFLPAVKSRFLTYHLSWL